MLLLIAAARATGTIEPAAVEVIVMWPPVVRSLARGVASDSIPPMRPWTSRVSSTIAVLMPVPLFLLNMTAPAMGTSVVWSLARTSTSPAVPVTPLITAFFAAATIAASATWPVIGALPRFSTEAVPAKPVFAAFPPDCDTWM